MKKLLFAAMTLTILVAFIETACAWFSAHYSQQLFSYRNEYMQNVSADQFERRTIFNIGGGKYRLIARVNYARQRVFILFIMKHSEYSKDRWK